MPIITERLDAYPLDETVLEIERDEELLLTTPVVKFVKLLNHAPLEVIHFPTEYISQPFSPPRGVYESHHLRVEWQQMKGRQPFYHRNADADELSFQVFGPRTLMTEYGIVEHRPGDFSRIPVGVAHDNFGQEEIHLLFYIPAPVHENVPARSTGELRIPPFEGWESQAMPEVTTNCIGGPECDIAAGLVDEKLLLQHVEKVDKSRRIQVLQPKRTEGEMEWMYTSKNVWIGYMKQSRNSYSGIVYTRHRLAEEIQCQIKGKRTIISQRGIANLEPGDFVNIPYGVAFTDVVHEDSEHISVLTHNPTPPKAPIARQAHPTSWSAVQALRN
ncbi:uncharacterized protein A1O9_04034 [Exophiala aquamarina CBS 119918]|uniref:Homogentisate 1,2-dioxygenase n=1 Tax=Exophiala aquamarina CBS 119918 TaxID=1182545 RepID=A0A072PUI7_9EURO|nr:uncharacterized protein A1O9_04034 [Exophiala aquamarina CBS 119918]KEF59190.1 hypothetical protein A1O9_04034 [Exophiala aquamarina CBS 119918]